MAMWMDSDRIGTWNTIDDTPKAGGNAVVCTGGSTLVAAYDIVSRLPRGLTVQALERAGPIPGTTVLDGLE